jgi:Na+-transporting methylmalonyl-CoA/oxaloacetate decarboxylase gamma subunit
MEAINLGLQLSLYGIVITFLALGLLILVISLLQVLFPAKAQEQATTAVSADSPLADEAEDPNTQLAVLAAAWWYWQKKRSSSLGEQLEKGPGKRWRKIDKA